MSKDQSVSHRLVSHRSVRLFRELDGEGVRMSAYVFVLDS